MKRDDLSLPLDLGRDSGVTLPADSLFANWGFGDGEMLDEHPAYLRACQEAGVDAERVDSRAVLADMIERHLLPALPAPLRTYRLESTAHNPVRAEDDELARRAEFSDFEVTVPLHAIVALLRPVVPAARGSTGSRSPIPIRLPKRDSHSATLDFPDELIIDNFAGGGGTSEGLEQAFGRPVDIAINHDPQALAMHALNHPFTKHLCESVWDVNPIKVTRNQPVGLVWLSPDCKHFSKAKGGTPVAKEIRGLAWVGMRWAALTKPRVIMLENVEEFQDWGPLIIGADGAARPDPAKKGKTFESFVRQLRGLGYDVDWKELRACDNGAPTIRKRLFMVARRDGIPIAFPDATHAEPSNRAVLAGKLLPYRTAAECIDFNLPARSIFGRKKDLAENTQRRVAKGLWRHVLTSPKPFIVGVGGRMGQSPARGVDQPAQTITAKADSCLATPILTPVIVGAGGPAFSGKPVSSDQPFGTLTTENHRAVAQPVLAPFVADQSRPQNAQTAGADEPLRTQCAEVKGGHFTLVSPTLAPIITTNTTGHSGAAVDEPLPTVATGGHHAVTAAALVPLAHGDRRPGEARTADLDAPVSTIHAGGGNHALAAAALAPLRGTSDGHMGGHSLDDPLSTVSAGGTHHALAAAHITKFRTGSSGSGMEEPMPTVTANSFLKRPGGAAPLGMVAAHLVDMGHGEGPAGGKRFSHGVRSVEQPLNTVTASGATSAVAAVHLTHLTHLTHHGDRPGQTPDKPLPTVTGANRGEQAMVSAWIEQANGGFYEGGGRPADAPMSTITAAGSNQQLVAAYAVKYYSSGGQWQGLGEPMHTLPTKGRMGLVQVLQVPADCLAEEHRARARDCAALLHKYLPEQFPDPAELVLVQHDGHWWVLVDITLRMLIARELFRAQSFPDHYIIHEIPDPAILFKDGVQHGDPREVPRIPLTATAQVRMCGNSVSPAQAKALVLANFGHERLIARRAA